MAWVIRLNDDIGYNPDTNTGISSAMFDAMFDTEGAKAAKEIDLIITSYGGSLYDGLNMYFRVKKEIADGKVINGIVSGMCASAATLPLLASSTVSAYKGSKFLPHNPTITTYGDAAAIQKTADMMLTLENEIAQIYANTTQKTFEEIKALMSIDDFMTADAAKEYGFIKNIIDFEPKAFATIQISETKKIQKQNNSNMKNEKISVGRQLLANMRAFLGIKAASAPLSDGTTILYFDGDALSVGVAVYTDEAMSTPAPDGDHTLSDGRMITVATGVITAVTDIIDDSAKTDEVAAKLSAAQAELATAQAKITELTAKNETEIVAMKKEFAKMKNDFEAKIKATAVGGGDPLKVPVKAKAFSEMTASEKFKFQHKMGEYAN